MPNGLSIGELTADLDANERPLVAGLTRAELAMRGFTVDAEGRLRTLDGRFASMAERAAAGLGDGRGVAGQSRRAQREVQDLDRGTGRLMSAFTGAVSAALGFAKVPALIGAGIPVVAGLVATLANIAPAAAVGATAVFSLAQAVGAIKIGSSGIGAALSAAFKAPSGGGGGGGGAAGAAHALADAQQAVADATDNAAYANKQAAKSVASAERDLADAQKAALAAQKAINDAREQARRDLEDMNDQLAEARLDEGDAVDGVKAAELALNKVRAAGSAASADDLAQAQREYDRAVLKLKEQREQVSRLEADTAAANKAGVDGSKTVVDAQQDVADANRDVADRVQALKDAQEEQARTAKQGIESIAKAQQALNDAMAGSGGGGGGGGGVDAFAAAMAKLAPSAQAFVRAVIALKPAWDRLQLDVQEHLFAGLAGRLTSTAAVVLPVLRRGLDGTATALNGMAKGVFDAARNLAEDGVLGRALDGAAKGLGNLRRVPGQVVTAFTQIAAAGAPQFDKLTKALGRGADTLAKKITDSFSSGGMGKAIDTAVDIIKQLGAVIGNVGKIIGSVLGAAKASGGGWLRVLQDITRAMADAFASPAVQSGLKALFSTMAALGKTVAPLVVSALKAIAPVLTALGPPASRLIAVLGDALQPIIKALGPVLKAAAVAVGEWADAARPMLSVIGTMVASLGPLLTPILVLVGKLFADLAPVVSKLWKSLLPPFAKIVQTVGAAFTKLAPVLDMAMRQLGTNGLTPIVMGLSAVISEFVTQYADQFTAMFTDLLPLIPALIPVVLQLAESIGEILTAVAPLLPKIMLLTAELITALLPAILPLIPPLAQLEIIFLRLATDVITKVVIPALNGLISFMQGMQHAMQPAIDAVTYVTTAISGAFEWLYDHLVGHSVIPDLVREIVRLFTGLPGAALRAVSSLPGYVGGVASDAAGRMIRAIGGGISNILFTLGQLGRTAASAVGNLGGTLWNAGVNLISGLLGGIRAMIPSLTGLLDWVTDLIPFHKGPPEKDAKLLRGAGRSIIGGLMDGISDMVPPLTSQLDGLTRGLGAGGGMGGPMAAGGAAGGSGGRVTVRLELSGPEEVKKLIRGIVQNDGGGDVQLAFGTR